MGVRKRIRNGKVEWFARYWVSGREFAEAAPTKALAVALLGKRKHEAAEGRIIPGKRRRCSTTVKVLLKRYIEAHEAEGKRSAETYRHYAKHLGCPPLGSKLVSEVVALDVERYRRRRAESTYRSGGSGPTRTTAGATINREIAVLKAAFNRAVEWGIIAANPLRSVRPSKEPPGRVRVLSTDEESRLLAACSPRLAVLVRVLLGTGLRRGEALALRWRDVDFDHDVLHVERSRPGGRAGTKAGVRNDVPMSTVVRDVFLGMPRGESDALVFATASGKPYANLRRDFDAACTGAGVADFRVHDTRHTFASRLVSAGVSLAVVADLLGHASVRMTQRYVHLARGPGKAAVELLAEIGRAPAVPLAQAAAGSGPSVSEAASGARSAAAGIPTATGTKTGTGRRLAKLKALK